MVITDLMEWMLYSRTSFSSTVETVGSACRVPVPHGPVLSLFVTDRVFTGWPVKEHTTPGHAVIFTVLRHRLVIRQWCSWWQLLNGSRDWCVTVIRRCLRWHHVRLWHDWILTWYHWSHGYLWLRFRVDLHWVHSYLCTLGLSRKYIIVSTLTHKISKRFLVLIKIETSG